MAFILMHSFTNPHRFMNTTTQPYVTTLTPLRGIAALLVVVFHSDLMVMPFMPPQHTSLVSGGWIWVDFFFILSGFIMSYVYARNFKKGITKKGYLKYIRARFARIYPLHLITLVIALIGAVIVVNIADGLDPFFKTMFDPSSAVPSLLLLQGMHLYDAAPLNTPSWSLSTEWWMYMIFPFLVPLFYNLKSVGKMVALILVIASYFGLMYYIGPLTGFSHTPTINLVADFGFLRCAAGFLLGMLVYEFYVTRAAYALLKNDITFIGLFAGVLVAMHFASHELLILAFFPLILLSAAYNQTIIKAILEKRPLQKLGDWSFSIYMVHVPIIYIFWIQDLRSNPKMFADIMALITREPDYILGLSRLCILLPATLIVAAVTYKYIEIPSRNYLNNLFKRKPQAVLIEPEPVQPVT